MLNGIKKHIHVSCAIIERDGRLLAAQRSATMSLPLKWEFPGGKINNEESPEECLKRELFEELGVEVAVCKPLTPVLHHYPKFTVTLYPFVCSIIVGEITLNEHAAIAWLTPLELHTLDWAEADVPLIDNYLNEMEQSIT